MEMLFLNFVLLNVAIVVIVAMLVAIVNFVKSLNTLLFPVQLDSLSLFKKFNPDEYLRNISVDEFRKIEKILEPGSRKNRMVVRWKYVTPAGRHTYSGSKSYNLDAVRFYVREMSALLRNDVPTINALYGRLLAKGEESIDVRPKIYGYVIHLPSHKGLVKVGYTKNSAHKRVKDQMRTAAHVSYDYDILFILPAMDIFGNYFTDHEVHKVLKSSHVENPMGEWFRCSPEVAVEAVYAVQNRSISLSGL